MTREEHIRNLAPAGVKEYLSGRIIDADEDLATTVSCTLFDETGDFLTDVFYRENEMTIRMEFQPDGVVLSVPQIDDAEYGGPRPLAYDEIPDPELAALHALVCGSDSPQTAGDR